MEPARYIVFGVLALGGLVALLCASAIFQRYGVAVTVFGEQLVKLIAADNIDRALRLCAAARKNYAARVLKPVVEASRDGAGESALRQTLQQQSERVARAEKPLTLGCIIALTDLGTAIALDWTLPGVPRGTASVIAAVVIAITLLAMSKVSTHRAKTEQAAEAVIAAINKQRA
ncbi:MAG: hypothetical protein KC503_28660 [Myxococcales bacterium]|nr:hypothetical protein [Myxococcales bacterium]